MILMEMVGMDSRYGSEGMTNVGCEAEEEIVMEYTGESEVVLNV